MNLVTKKYSVQKPAESALLAGQCRGRLASALIALRKAVAILAILLSAVVNAAGQDRLTEQFRLFAANTTRERVYLHMNQHYARPGDRLWFNAFVFDDANQQLSEASKVLYINVVGQQGQVVMEEKVPLDAGTGEGYLDIPADFNQGVYIVRAFTGWMRNFGTELFFRDFLWVGLRPSAISINESHPDRPEQLSISIIPEGHMNPVAGLTSRFTVRLVSDSTRGVVASCRVVDDKCVEVASFTTNRFGYGAFILRPEMGGKYRVTVDGSTASFALPEVAPNGMAMLLTTSPTAVRVSFQSQGQLTEKFRTILQSKGTIYLDQPLDFSDQPARVLSIPLSQLKPGIYSLSVLNQQGLEVGQRVFQVNGALSSMQLNVARTQLDRRERARIDFSPAQAVAYSVSVSDRLLEGSYEAPSVHDVCYGADVLAADGREMLHFFDPEFRKPENWDLYLLTRRHPAYDWKQIAKYEPTYPRWPYEKYISAYGQVRNRDGFILGDGLFTFYSFAHQEIIPARTDQNGWFLLPVFDFYGTTKIVGLAENKNVAFSGMRIDIESGLPDTGIEKQMFALLEETSGRFAEQKRDKQTFRTSFGPLVPGLYPERKASEPGKEFSPVTKNTDDYYLDLREYLSFSSLREVFIEIGRGIVVRERKGETVIMMYDPYKERLFDEPALIFVNGIPTIDYNLVLTLDPDAIETIRLYRSATAQERFGALGRNGILSIATKDKALEIPNQENISFYFEGFQPQEEFSNAALNPQKPHMPDFRHQLYWRTGTTLPAYIECTLSDVLSDFVVKVVAIGPDGQLKVGAAEISTLPTSLAEER